MCEVSLNVNSNMEYVIRFSYGYDNNIEIFLDHNQIDLLKKEVSKKINSLFYKFFGGDFCMSVETLRGTEKIFLTEDTAKKLMEILNYCVSGKINIYIFKKMRLTLPECLPFRTKKK